MCLRQGEELSLFEFYERGQDFQPLDLVYENEIEFAVRHVGGGDKTMQLVTGSFAQRGGPDFSLYLDTSVFLSTEMDGKCCFARADDASMDAYLEIGYHPGADAQTLAGTILNDYGTIATTESLGQVKLGDLNAYGVNGATVQRQLEAYLIPTAYGCISVVLCRAGTAPAGWYESLLASAQTLQIAD